jgi:protein TonB
MYLPISRTLVQALIISLLIHVVLLLGVAVLPPVQPEVASTAINVIVSREASNVSPQQAASIPSAKPVLVPANPSSSISRKPPAQTIIAADQSNEAPVASAQPATQDAAVSAQAAPAVEAKTGAISAPASTLAREGVSANEITELRFSLSKAAKRFKVYPRLAQERGWEGTVEVMLIFTARSPVPDINLAHSSGRTILDEQAMDMAARAARATVLPAGLKGQEFQVPLPVKFSLEDEQ